MKEQKTKENTTLILIKYSKYTKTLSQKWVHFSTTTTIIIVIIITIIVQNYTFYKSSQSSATQPIMFLVRLTVERQQLIGCTHTLLCWLSLKNNYL